MSTKSRLILPFILLLGAFLRFYHLDGYGLWSDEFVTLMIVSERSYVDLIKTCFEIPQPMPPLYFLLDKSIFDLFVPSEIALRLLSAVSSLITNYLVFALGRTLFDQEAALYGSLLFAVNSTQIVYAQNARPYAFCLMLSTVSMLCFLKWLREPARRFQVGYIISTALLFYAHYVFFPLLLIQNSYFWWKQRIRKALPVGDRASAKVISWKSWLGTQSYVAVLLLPLCPQIWRIIQARQNLNWERRYPRIEDLFLFLQPRLLLLSAAALLVMLVVKSRMRKFRAEQRRHKKVWSWKIPRPDGLVLVSLWYLIPVMFFFLLVHGGGINLFVERYLILASLPTFLLLPSLALSFQGKSYGRSFLLIFLVLYVCFVPGRYLTRRGEFSQGVPGGNQWRETLTELNRPDFQATLLLFQSPFIESNQLGYLSNSKLFDYLSAPLRSFYAKNPSRPFVLLPVHWWIQNPAHQAFKTEIARILVAGTEFTLVSTQEFWDHFEPWLKREFSAKFECQIVRTFRSSGALCLQRIGLRPTNRDASNAN
jgi:4-amino-4-deoxy-L-arabinose transferase-like glycosyltransferase